MSRKLVVSLMLCCLAACSLAQSNAYDELARSGKQADTDTLVQLIRTGTPKQRSEAVKALSSLPDYLRDLINQAKTGVADLDKLIAQFENIFNATKPYVLLGPKMERFIVDSNSPDPSIRKDLIVYLVSAAADRADIDPNEPRSGGCGNDPDSKLIGEFLNDNQPLVTQLLQDPSFHFKQNLLGAIVKVSDSRLEGVIENLMSSPVADTRMAALFAASCSKKLAQYGLEKASKDTFVSIRQWAAQRAFDLIGPDSLVLLVALSRDRSTDVRAEAKSSYDEHFRKPSKI